MKTKRTIIFIVLCLVIFVSMQVSARQQKQESTSSEPVSSKTIALGDVVGSNASSPSDAAGVKEAVQILVKKELEKIGKGRYNVNIVSSTVAREDKEDSFPALPENRAPTAAEMAKFTAAMQKMQMKMSGQPTFKPVKADAYVDFRIQSGSGSVDTSGVAGTIGQLSGIDTSLGSLSTSSTKLYLVCNMRNPADGMIIDRYTAKTSSVNIQNIAGFSSYDYGGQDETTKERLFSQAAVKCAKWISDRIK